MSHTESKELTQVKMFIDKSKLDEEQLINKLEEREGHILHDIVLYHILKCELLGERGLFEDAVKLAEQASAQNRIKSFINELQKNKEVWDTFLKFFQMNKEIQMTDLPSLESLIKEIFIDRTLVTM